MPKEKDIVTYSETRSILDSTTGEFIVHENVTVKKKGVEPNYIKLYLNTLMSLTDLPKNCSPMLYSLLGYMSYSDQSQKDGGQIIYVNAHIKKEICNELEIKMNTLDKALGQFVKSGIFRRIGTGTYQVNPYFFGRGEWKNISAIRATFNFGEKLISAGVAMEYNGEDNLLPDNGTDTAITTTAEEPEEKED